MSDSEEEGRDDELTREYAIPEENDGLRACKVCTLVMTYRQFVNEGTFVVGGSGEVIVFFLFYGGERGATTPGR